MLYYETTEITPRQKMPSTSRNRQYIGLFIGTAIGDAMGLPKEGISPKRAQKLFGNRLQPSFLVLPYIKRLGICSDDTDHLVLTAFAILKNQSGNHQTLFAKELAYQIKRWFLTCPPGIGMATIKASLKLIVGISYKKSGVFSAGNGAVMRAPVIGAFYADDFNHIQGLLKISTQMTHTDPKAFEGALAIALAAAIIIKSNPSSPPITEFFATIQPLIQGKELKASLLSAQEALLKNESVESFAQKLGLTKNGVSGYVNHTVPVVIYCWLRYFNDYSETITQIIRLGGDTDSNAAIVGALAGMTVGEDGIPKEWIDNTRNWPISINFLRKLARALAEPKNVTQIHLPLFLFLLLKNLLSFPVIIIHGFRRLFPPY